MTQKKTATGQVAASTAMSANGNHAHPHDTTVVKGVAGWQAGMRAIWRNADHDLPVTLTGLLGDHEGQRWWAIEGSATGVPEAELLPESGDMLGDISDLLSQAKVEPADVLSALKVQTLIDLVATYQGIARQAGLEALTRLISYLPAGERQRLNLYSGGLFVQGKQAEAFLAQCSPPPGEPLFKPLSLSSMLALPPKQWLIRDILGAGDLVMLYGPPGGGKTFVVIDLIFAACLRQQFAGRFDVTRALTVAYCAGEGVGGLPQRFAAAAEYYGAPELPGFTFFAAAPQLFSLDSDPTAETIGRFVQEWKARQAAGTAGQLDLLVIDTMHAATTGADENSAQDMGKVLAALKVATKELGCAVLVVHHSNKQGSAERGSSALRGAMDAVISIFPATSKFSMAPEKIKDAQLWKGQTFDLVVVGDSVRVWWDEVHETSEAKNKQSEDIEAIVALLKSASGRRYPATAVAEGIGMGGSKYVFKLLPRAIQIEPGIKSGLKHPERDPSPHNPLVYWYEPDVKVEPEIDRGD